jgi:hypothetical protein
VAGAPIGAAVSAAPGRLVGLDVHGENLLVVRQRVVPLGWTVFAAVPRDEAYAGATSIRTTVLTIAIPLDLLVSAGIFLLLRTTSGGSRLVGANARQRGRARSTACQ